MDVWDSWIAIGLLSVAAWGLSCVIDVCFVGENIYRRPVDGTVVAGLFCVVPMFTFNGVAATFNVDWPITVVAALAGISYLLHIHYYFKALFTLNDASNAEIFNTLSVLVVPVLAFLLLGEVLAPLHYAAVGLSVLAIVILIRLQIATLTWRVAVLLGNSVVAVSVAMVLQAWVLQFVSYATAVSLFSMSAFLGAMFLLSSRKRLRGRISGVVTRFGVLLVGVQLLELGGVLGLQRATDLGPSVSMVALLECSLPVFVMAFSWILLGATRIWRSGASDRLRTALASQSSAYPAKLISLVLIVSAIGLAQY